MRGRTSAPSLVLFLALLTPLLSSHAAAGRAGARVLAADCEGGACAHVAVTFDDAKEQYRVRNDSADRWVKVAASNVSSYASVCVGPGKAEFLPLKSIVGAYRAEYAPEGCAPPNGE